jgi:hypothetical protein
VSADTGVTRRNPRFPVGVNYYPLDSGASTWEEWYAGDIDADFADFEPRASPSCGSSSRGSSSSLR